MSGRLNGPLAMVFGWGWIGVDLFFVLSGFLITGILYDTKGSEDYFRNFYARRTLRIMPLYYGFLFIAIALPRLGCSFCGWISGDDAVSLGLYIFNFRAAFSQRDWYGVIFHFWSLSVEEHFYLLWPFAVWSLRRRTLMRLCLGVAALSFLLRVVLVLSGAPPRVPCGITPCRLDGLLSGSFVALARRDQSDWAEVRRWSKRLFWGSGCLLLGLALGQRHFLLDADPSRGHGVVDGKLVVTLGIASLAVFFSSLIAEAVDATEGSHSRRFLEGHTLRAIGKYSYAMYVFHVLIQAATVQLLSPLEELPAYIAKPLAVVWVTAVSFAAAWLSYHLYEKRFLQMKRYFEYHQHLPSTSIVSPQIVTYENA